ncbi:MAG: phage tail protein, partial [Tenacibaculum sp.]|nr:phage tail protein [Tenacibaculum sp.]
MRINFTNGYKDIIPNDESYRLRAIMGSNEINLKFSLPEYIEFPLGSYVNYQNQRYTLNSPAIINEVNSTNFEYSMTLGSPQDLLKNYKIKDTQGRLKFPITAKPSEHLELLVHNLNQNNGGWSVGACIEKHEKLISYNHTNCYDALNTIASEFKTEFEIVGKTIHLRKVEYDKDNPLPLSYGKGNGFVSGVGRNNDDQKAGFNVLYIQGGDRNIDLSKYGNKELLLPKNQRYTYEGVTYQTDAKGLCISVVGDTSVTENRKEESLDLSQIYPKRVGSVSRVVVENAEKNFYNFTDTTIPQNLNFNDCLIKGNKEFTISFQSGMLSGREFEATYDHSKREFKLVPKEEDGYTMPGSVFVPEIGDKYAVLNMQMPDAYICDNASKTGASWELFKEACKHFYENHESKFTFKGTLDGIWAKKDWLSIGGRIKMGGFIRFSDPKFQPNGIDIRITSVKDYLNNPHSPIIELANSVQGGSIATELDKIKENEVVRDDLHKRSIDYTKRRFRDVEETMKMLEKAQLNFGKGINPITV